MPSCLLTFPSFPLTPCLRLLESLHCQLLPVGGGDSPPATSGHTAVTLGHYIMCKQTAFTSSPFPPLFSLSSPSYLPSPVVLFRIARLLPLSSVSLFFGVGQQLSRAIIGQSRGAWRGPHEQRIRDRYCVSLLETNPKEEQLSPSLSPKQ